MAVCNEITREQLAEMNSRASSRDRDHGFLREMPSIEGYIEFMNAGLEKIEGSPSKHLLFARSEKKL